MQIEESIRGEAKGTGLPKIWSGWNINIYILQSVYLLCAICAYGTALYCLFIGV